MVSNKDNYDSEFEEKSLSVSERTLHYWARLLANKYPIQEGDLVAFIDKEDQPIIQLGYNYGEENFEIHFQLIFEPVGETKETQYQLSNEEGELVLDLGRLMQDHSAVVEITIGDRVFDYVNLPFRFQSTEVDIWGMVEDYLTAFYESGYQLSNLYGSSYKGSTCGSCYVEVSSRRQSKYEDFLHYTCDGCGESRYYRIENQYIK